MDKRPGSKKRPTKSARKDAAKPLRIEPDYEQPFPKVYANYASISNTPFEFAIDFCNIGPPHRQNASQNILYAPVNVRVLIPSQMVSNLINALQTQLSKSSNMPKED